MSLYLRCKMHRPNAFPALSTSFKAALAAAMTSVVLASCDTYTTSVAPPPDRSVHVHVNTVEIAYTAAQKDSIAAAAAADAASPSRMVPIGPMSNVIGAPTSVSATVAACDGGAGAFAGYSKSQVAFEPEPIPNIVPFPLSDDGFIPDTDVPIGFNFDFQGQTYDKVNVYMNGFLLFGTRPGTNGFPSAGSIPSTAAPRRWSPARP